MKNSVSYKNIKPISQRWLKVTEGAVTTILLILSYPGIKSNGRAEIEEHFHENEKRTWTNFSSQIQAKIEHPVIGRIYGQALCYSLYMELEKAMVRDMTRFKELHCFVSLLGPFYTIIGQDRSEVKIDEGFCSTTNCLILLRKCSMRKVSRYWRSKLKSVLRTSGLSHLIFAGNKCKVSNESTRRSP